MEFGWFHDDEEGLTEINITPLVDVSLVLLIIFMITAPMLVQGASVDLPRTRAMNKLPSGNVFVTVDENGDIYLNDIDTPLELTDLEERLIPFIELGQSVYLRGDKATNYGRIMEVMDAITSAGLDNVNLVTTPVPLNQR
ncbi:MAG: biopolymer transporter ExbD [Acidobacteria bacterium]|nr:biopolymer transporter ExbD [Acidobacteriota bacterium]